VSTIASTWELRDRDPANKAARVSKPRVRADVPNLFVVPAFNEIENLPRLLEDLEARPELFPAGSRLFIVDDGSSDGTAEWVARYRGPVPTELVSYGENRGPGAAFRAGFDAALAICDDDANVVTLEADTTSDLNALDAMLGEIDAGQSVPTVRWIGRQVAVEDRLHQRPQHQAVRPGDQVDRAAHQRHPHQLPVEDQPGQIVGRERVQPSPQPDVGRIRFLRLHADEVLDGRRDSPRLASQQQLAGQQRPVERLLG